jgi:hypothetical protein
MDCLYNISFEALFISDMLFLHNKPFYRATKYDSNKQQPCTPGAHGVKGVGCRPKPSFKTPAKGGVPPTGADTLVKTYINLHRTPRTLWHKQAYQRQEALARRARGESSVTIARSYDVSHQTILRLA